MRGDRLASSASSLAGISGVVLVEVLMRPGLAVARFRLWELHWAPAKLVAGDVTLADAQDGDLCDNWTLPNGSWPTSGGLCLDGFIYGSLAADRPVDVLPPRVDTEPVAAARGERVLGDA